MAEKSDLLIYQAPDGIIKIDVRLEKETVWLTQAQLVKLFESSKANISEHLKHIFASGELEEQATVRKFRTVQYEYAELKKWSVGFPDIPLNMALCMTKLNL